MNHESSIKNNSGIENQEPRISQAIRFLILVWSTIEFTETLISDENNMKALFTFLILLPLHVYSGVSILNSCWDESFISAKSISQVDICAIDAEGLVVQVHATIRNELGNKLLEVISAPISIEEGVNRLRPTIFFNIEYSSDSEANYTMTEGRLPIGNYSFCLEISEFNGGVLDECCDVVYSEPNEYLTLSSPFDSLRLAQPPQNFIWNHRGNFGDLLSRYYQMLVVELKEGQSPNEALENNIPIWTSSPVTTHVVQYPENVAPLEAGKYYVWQIQMIYRNHVKQCSPPATFLIIGK